MDIDLLQPGRREVIGGSSFGPILGYGFWLLASERFDPHTAKETFSQSAWSARRLARLPDSGQRNVEHVNSERPGRSPLRVLAEAPFFEILPRS